MELNDVDSTSELVRSFWDSEVNTMVVSDADSTSVLVRRVLVSGIDVMAVNELDSKLVRRVTISIVGLTYELKLGKETGVEVFHVICPDEKEPV